MGSQSSCERLFFNNERHETAWGGLASTTYFLTTKKHKKTRKFFKVAALKHEPYPEKPHVRPINLVW